MDRHVSRTPLGLALVDVDRAVHVAHPEGARLARTETCQGQRPHERLVARLDLIRDLLDLLDGQEPLARGDLRLSRGHFDAARRVAHDPLLTESDREQLVDDLLHLAPGIEGGVGLDL